jgi:tRNA G18 (ribose-2'-O)-methylase SpoU
MTNDHLPRKLTSSELNRPTREEYKALRKLPVVIVLDNIRSLHNVGSVFRISDAFGVEAIHLCGITATPPHREIHRTALGATESVIWKYFNTAKDSVVLLKDQGYKIIAVEQTDQSFPLHSFIPEQSDKLALVFGNEVQGIDESIFPFIDHVIEIPQVGTKHSLNVSVTVGIVIWDILTKLGSNIF